MFLPPSSSSSSSSSPALLLFALALVLLPSPDHAYYAQHFYLPAGEVFGGPFGARFGQPPVVVRREEGNPPPIEEAIGAAIKEEEEQQRDEEMPGGRDEGRGGRIAQQIGIGGGQHPPTESKIPRRTLRHFLAAEFGGGRMGRQYKRMRPCFYSPIQCLMKKKRSSPA